MGDEKLIEELKKLSPEERIRKLKEIEEKIKEEMQKIKELTEKTKQEVKEEEERKLLELVPEQEEIRIEDLFRTEETLEEQAQQAQSEQDSGETQVKYLINDLEERREFRELLNNTYETRRVVEETINKYNPMLGERIMEKLTKLAETIKNMYTHKI